MSPADFHRRRSVAQLAAQRSPKPQVAGSSPVTPAISACHWPGLPLFVAVDLASSRSGDVCGGQLRVRGSSSNSFYVSYQRITS